MHKLLKYKSVEWSNIIKVGRTHLQDATPITLGQEFSGYAAALEYAIYIIQNNLHELHGLAQGGTAVGTGINTHTEFANNFIVKINSILNDNFYSNANKFASLSLCDSLMQISGCFTTIATSLNKIANDIRLLGSGPRCGFGELELPANEPGSSIMPGKVNPTQCEALTMICAQVIGNNTTITIAASSGHLELNVYRPVIIFNILQSIMLISDGCNSFSDNCLADLKANEARIKEFSEKSLMIVAALNPYIGYDKSAQIAKEAHKYGLTLKQAAVKLNILSEQEFDKYVNISEMV